MPEERLSGRPDRSGPSAPDDRLDSWKEIAAYLRRHVNTVQRWAKTEGLPVHRHFHHTLGSVYGLKSEIDTWWNRDGRRSIGVRSGSELESTAATRSIVVGRSRELSHLHQLLSRTLEGERRLVLVSGELGVGKTTLVDAFTAEASADGHLAIGHGQCVEEYGPGEAYLPILDALERLCRQPQGRPLLSLLTSQAPSWLARMPSLRRQAVGHDDATRGGTHERMPREIVEVLDVFTKTRPLLLVFEDLHWSDRSTVELLGRLARRKDPAHLLVCGTLRHEDMLTATHPLGPLVRELRAHGDCDEIILSRLSADDVATYVAARFQTVPDDLATLVYRRTEGNPLFIVNLLQFLIDQGHLVARDGRWDLTIEIAHLARTIPTTIHALLGDRLARLGAHEHQLLEIASVVGSEFSAPAVAAGSDGEAVTDVEGVLESLARRQQFIRPVDAREWPDGTQAAGYTFAHGLYQEVLYQHVLPSTRASLHGRVAWRLETGYGARTIEIAAELARHFDRAGIPDRAIVHYRQAADQALTSTALHEAHRHLMRALELLVKLPPGAERDDQELQLRLAVGTTVTGLRGYADPEVETAFLRALELSERLQTASHTASAAGGLLRCYGTRGEWVRSLPFGERLVALARELGDQRLQLEAAHLHARALASTGRFGEALTLVNDAVRYLNQIEVPSQSWLSVGYDCRPALLFNQGLLKWYLGYPEQARRSVEACFTLLEHVPHTETVALGHVYGAWVYQLLGNAQRVFDHTERARQLGERLNIRPVLLLEAPLRGWALARLGQAAEGLLLIRNGIAAQEAARMRIQRPYMLALLAEVLLMLAPRSAESVHEALDAVATGLAVGEASEERMHAADLHRLKGELLLARAERSDRKTVRATRLQAEACFEQALVIARAQHAKSLELRAAIGLARLWASDGKRAAARQKLRGTYNWFTEGFESPDLKNAQTLLTAIG